MAYYGPTKYAVVAEWLPAQDGVVPPEAVMCGYDEGEQIYVGRARHQGDLIPGKVHPTHGCCYVGINWEEHRYNRYQVLCSTGACDLDWEPCSGGDVPPGSLQGGITEVGEALYIGRVQHEDAMVPGKIHPSCGCLYVPYGGREHAYSEYEVLVCKALKLQ